MLHLAFALCLFSGIKSLCAKLLKLIKSDTSASRDAVSDVTAACVADPVESSPGSESDSGDDDEPGTKPKMSPSDHGRMASRLTPPATSVALDPLANDSSAQSFVVVPESTD